MKASKLLQKENGPEAVARADVASIAAHKARLERALAETRKERESGSIMTNARAALENIDKLVTAPPEPGAPGIVKIQLIGLFREAGRQSTRAPLPGASVRLTAGEQTLAEGKTDVLGIAALAFPERRPTGAEIQVLGANGAVLVRDTVQPKDENVVRKFELAPTDALAGSFDRARRWVDERLAAAQRLHDAGKRVEQALARQEQELIKLIQQANAELERCGKMPEAPAPRPPGREQNEGQQPPENPVPPRQQQRAKKAAKKTPKR
jgi:hypothetical protein